MGHFINFTVYRGSPNKSTFLVPVKPPVKVSGVVNGFPSVTYLYIYIYLVISPLTFIFLQLSLVIINTFILIIIILLVNPFCAFMCVFYRGNWLGSDWKFTYPTRNIRPIKKSGRSLFILTESEDVAILVTAFCQAAL